MPPTQMQENSVVNITAAKLGSKTNENFISLADEQFVRDVVDDIKCYLKDGSDSSVLIFPPLSSYKRLLIHKAREDFDNQLDSFSIGVSDDRRIVVCRKEIIICHPGTSKGVHMGYEVETFGRQNKDDETAAAVSKERRISDKLIYRPPAERHLEKTEETAEKIRSSRTKQRRPDRAVYVPRAKRSIEATTQTQNEIETPIEPKKHHTPIRKSLDRTYCNVYTPPHLRQRLKSSEKVNDLVNCDSKVIESNSSDNNCVKDFDYVQYNISDNVSNSDITMEEVNHMDQRLDYAPIKNKEDEILNEEINSTNRRIIRQRFKNDVLVISDPVVENKDIDAIETLNKDVNNDYEEIGVVKPKLEGKSSIKREDNDWDSVFDENGECLDPSLLEELSTAVGKVRINKPKNNYEQYQTKSQIMLSGPYDESFGHVVEVYNFPAEFKTNDLLAIFSDYKDTGFEIKWVDDTHALIVFSSSKIAAEVVSTTYPIVKTRLLHEATLESRQKAKKSAQFLQPYRQRPETCAALARRLVTGALGLKPVADTDHDRKIIKMAREKKRQAALHKEAAWNGSLTSPNCEDS